ncbi:MAG: hypothetical protein ABSH46_13550 [Bryobacteraceae bacterium]|jgi:hypothetical protein
MQNVSSARQGARRILPVAAGLLVAVLLLASPAFGQQEYVGRFDAFAGFTYLNSPHVSLAEKGFHFQTGVRVVRWLSLGFDYSRSTGDLTLTPNLLVAPLAEQIATQIAGLQAEGALPASYTLTVPASSTTQTFAAGPQVSFHHWKQLTLFIRPDLGAIHEVAVPHPLAGDFFAAAVVQQLAPSGQKIDTTYFYGFGGGADFNITKNFGIRVQADFVHDHLFSDILKDARNTVRVSIGPAFQFGGNVK